MRVCVSLIELLLWTVMRRSLHSCICYWVRVGFYDCALSLTGDECSRPRGHGLGHAYPESESSRVGWLDARVTPGTR
jgi:hypothetical protein